MLGPRQILITVATVLVAFLACHSEQVSRPPNLLVISLDTLRSDHLGLYGYSRPTSPHLDAFGEESVVFERAVSQSASTTPSHRALFQSRPASSYQREGTMLAEVLSGHGYATAAWTGGGNIAARLGFGKGFDHYVEDDGGLAGSLSAVRVWLEQQREGPFFLFLHSYDIHLPYDPPPPHDDLFFPEYRGSLSGSETRDLLRRVRKAGQYKDLAEPPDVSEEDRRRIVALYDGGIHYTDQLVGRFLAELRELGLDQNTHVVVLSDHGEEFWDHGSVTHSHTVYEELVRVPLIWRFPDRRHAGRRIDSLVRMMDVAPTALEALGLAIPAEFQGRSLIALIEGQADEPRAAVSEMGRLRAWTEGAWKMIVDQSDGSESLFHLEDDPAEQKDLHRVHPEIAARLRQNLLRSRRGGDGGTVREMEPGIEDSDLRERLRALGYID